MSECYDLGPRHRGEIRDYTDGVYTHPLCDRHAEQAGFKAPETADELLSRIALTYSE